MAVADGDGSVPSNVSLPATSFLLHHLCFHFYLY
uniref:Uncharacterized protein n=1 Tax=Solanum lycopersicum TaxID=4081 RepID=A0A3Q7JDN2_SOLLC